MKFIPIFSSSKEFRGYTCVDDEDFVLLENISFSMSQYGYVLIYKGGKQHRLHRYLMGLYSFDGKHVVDHIDLNKLNNQKSNLRIATYHQNNLNTSGRVNNKYSNYRGVTWSKKDKKWRAAVQFNYKYHYVGDYKTELEAASAVKSYRMDVLGLAS